MTDNRVEFIRAFLRVRGHGAQQSAMPLHRSELAIMADEMAAAGLDVADPEAIARAAADAVPEDQREAAYAAALLEASEARLDAMRDAAVAGLVLALFEGRLA